MKILVAEDDPLSGAILKKLLLKLGHEPLLVKDGSEAFHLFQKEPTHIVISDWLMPGLTGLELCSEIRGLKLPDYTHFILQTSNSSEDSYQEAMESGVDDFLPKPVGKAELHYRLRVAERMIRQRDEANRQIRTLARFPEDNPNPVLQLDREGTVLYANEAASKCLNDLRCEVGKKAPPRLNWLVKQLFGSGARQEVDITAGHRIFSFASTSILEESSTYLYGHDITDRKQAEAEIIRLKDEAVHLALHDQLTGLPNRTVLSSRMEQTIASAQRHQRRFAILMIDIDNFKSVNDGLGHDVGDRLIVLVGETLQKELRKSDTLCRWGGDELVAILPDIKGDNNVGPICDRLNRSVKEAVERENIDAPVSLSIGFAIYPDHSRELETLMQQADQALYDAKGAGRDCWRGFTTFPAGPIKKSSSNLLFRLNQAVKQDLLTVHFQPLIETSNGRPESCEALARWEDNELGRIPPDQFIPLAEEKGLIVELGRQVLEKTLQTVQQWHRNGWAMAASVNVSRRQLMQPDYRESVCQAVERHNVPPGTVTLEITEREAFMDHPICRRNIEMLVKDGFRLSLDDFGSGFSTFDLLSELPFHELKLNKGLVNRIHNPRAASVVKAIVELARSLDLQVVAEGVENRVQQDYLTRLGVHRLQGFLFSRPLPMEDFDAYLKSELGTSEKSAA